MHNNIKAEDVVSRRRIVDIIVTFLHFSALAFPLFLEDTNMIWTMTLPCRLDSARGKEALNLWRRRGGTLQ